MVCLNFCKQLHRRRFGKFITLVSVLDTFRGVGVLLDAGTYLLGWQRSLLLHIAQGTRQNKEGRLFVFSCHCLLIDMPGGAIGSISAVESSYKLYVRRFGQSPSSTPPLPSMLWTMTFSILQSIDHQDHKLVRTNIFCFIFGHDHFLSLVA